MRTLLLLLVLVSLLAGSFKAVAHVDGAGPASSHASAQASGDADVPAGDDSPPDRKHCDLCSHGFGHLASSFPVEPLAYVAGDVRADRPAIPPPATRPDLQDRPPK